MLLIRSIFFNFSVINMLCKLILFSSISLLSFEYFFTKSSVNIFLVHSNLIYIALNILNFLFLPIVLLVYTSSVSLLSLLNLNKAYLFLLLCLESLVSINILITFLFYPCYYYSFLIF